MWFERMTGFKETSPETVRRHLAAEGSWLESLANGRRWHMGCLSIPSLQELRERNDHKRVNGSGRLAVSETVADVQALHCDPANAGTLFQVASQFNLLEMVGPEVTPEMGIDRYESDPTQGPACAIACGAGTIFRNYFVPVGGGVGQSAERQIDCLADLGNALGNEEERLWQMQNGYCLATAEGLEKIARILLNADEEAYESLKGKIRVGLQQETEVTLQEAGHRVTQAYCSALPVGYSRHPSALWEPFARLVLEAAYEATLLAAFENFQKRGNPVVYLTLLGGGAFGNDAVWILGALQKALKRFEAVPLDVRIVSHRLPNPLLRMIL
ncbi:hypothetical protein [Hydrogenimonas sp.]